VTDQSSESRTAEKVSVSDTPEARPSTRSAGSTRLGVAALLVIGLLLLFGLVLSPPDVNQKDAVRLFYVHVPSIVTAYAGFFLTLVGSVVYLRNGSKFWDLLAGASGEIGVLFCGFALVSGAVWGRPTWGVYWVWDARLTSTTVLFIMYIGYLAVRRMELPPEVRSRRAAVLGIVSFLNVFIVRYSVQWWRGLHQGQTLGQDEMIDGALITFSLLLGFLACGLTAAWLILHRFRVAWLEDQVEELMTEQALVERRREAGN